MRRLFSARLTMTLLLTGFATAALAQQGAQRVLRASTDFGMLTLRLNLSDRQVEGFYEDASDTNSTGRVFGEISASENTVSAVWVQKSSSDNPCMSIRYGSRYWGRVVFSYSDSPKVGTAVSGRWGYCEDKPERPWNGTVVD